MRLTFVVAAAIALGQTAPAQESLRDKVRKQGDVGMVILNEYPGAEMADLVREADLIAHVMVQGENVRLSSEGSRLGTRLPSAGTRR